MRKATKTKSVEAYCWEIRPPNASVRIVPSEESTTTLNELLAFTSRLATLGVELPPGTIFPVSKDTFDALRGVHFAMRKPRQHVAGTRVMTLPGEFLHEAEPAFAARSVWELLGERVSRSETAVVLRFSAEEWEIFKTTPSRLGGWTR